MSQKFHVKRNDVVVVISGSHKGKTGKISSRSFPPSSAPASKASR